MNQNNSGRIVITGCGIVSPLGCGTETVWRRLIEVRSGITVLPPEISEGTGVSVAGRVPSLAEDPDAGYEPERYITPKERKRMDRFIEFALIAAQKALTQAGWQPDNERARERTETVIASGVGGFGAIADAVRTTDASFAFAELICRAFSFILGAPDSIEREEAPNCAPRMM
ncbi:beta-ketoacyl synthase N-terminal-like domain-containing protein [Pantoea piersonii]|uniref:beta-ketoacyl synthase N-terminal-like domain-containing protein n=1 Tax=Pantoea piersonii TaxID=2364647 RepID=UPI00289D274C|nr:beta-ketoacyl synthase N-terminal-like domain-containing protein [Pantoea piersonii]